MKVSEAFDLYKKNYMAIKNQSVRLQEEHLLTKRKFIEHIGDKEVSEVTTDDISLFFNAIKKGRSINTVRNYLTRVRSVFRYLSFCEVDCISPNLIVIPKRVDTIPTFLTAGEIDRMIDNAFSLRNKFVLSLLYSSGIRLSEMISLNRGQIVNKSFSVIGKGGKARLCFIDGRTEDLMNKYLEQRQDNCEALIVSAKFKERMTPTNVQLLVSNSARRAGITKKVTPHTLRHSFATNFLQNNGNIRYLSQLMGHANLQTTAHYAHVVDEDLRKQYEKFHTC